MIYDCPADATNVSARLAPRFCGPPCLYAEKDGELLCLVCKGGYAPHEHLISKGHRKKLENIASLCAAKNAEWPLCYRNAGP
eukprot:6483539-Lingulodinium_polyedra.AAC.1